MRNEKYPLYKVEAVKNLNELVNFAAEKYGDNPAFSFERSGETITISYRRFQKDVEALRTALSAMGIVNSKVAVIGENSYEWILTYFAVVNSGNIIVPLNNELPFEDIKSLTDNSETKVFVFSSAYSDATEYLQKNKASIQYYISMDKIPELVEHGETAIKNGDNSAATYEIDCNALAVLLYTSGTTGTAKGVMLSHKNIMNDAVAACRNISFPHSSLLVLPLFHSFAIVAGVLMLILTGTSIAINKSLKDLHMNLQKVKPHNIMLVPLLVETFFKRINGAVNGSTDKEMIKKTISEVLGENLAIIGVGGAPIDKKYIEGFREWGVSVLEGYGITECSPVVSVNRNEYHRAGSVGPVLSCCEVKILSPDENGDGEICVKGDNVMLGYYKNEQATKDAFDDKWFKTGDVGRIDNDGFLFINGRKKNLIILSNGKNVYPEELEFNITNSIPYVKETIVYAKENIITAEVFLDTDNYPDCGSRLNDDILELNKSLPVYKNIGKTVIRSTEFPKTSTRKIKRLYNEGNNND